MDFATYIAEEYNNYIKKLKCEKMNPESWTTRNARDIVVSKKYFDAFDLEELMADLYEFHGVNHTLVFFEGKTFSMCQDKDGKWIAPSLEDKFPDEPDAVREWLKSIDISKYVSCVYRYDRPKPGTTYKSVVDNLRRNNKKIFL